MVLKKKTPVNGELTEKDSLKNKLSLLREQRNNISSEIKSIKNRLAEIDLAPFKVGDVVMCEVSAGRTKKVQKCLVEIDDGVVYVRPYKNDGELSNRHFAVWGKYTEAFEKVE